MIRKRQDTATGYTNKPDSDVSVLTILAARELVASGIDPTPLLRKSRLPSPLSGHTLWRVPVRSQSIFLDLAADAL